MRRVDFLRLIASVKRRSDLSMRIGFVLSLLNPNLVAGIFVLDLWLRVVWISYHLYVI